MNRHLTLVATTAITAAMLFAPVPVHAETRAACVLDPSFLPYTADAAQAWFDNCRERRLVSPTADGGQTSPTDPGRA
ncbi:MAG: hypothetical protein ABIQ59_17980 [Nocardioidaceae bacterium]